MSSALTRNVVGCHRSRRRQPPCPEDHADTIGRPQVLCPCGVRREFELATLVEYPRRSAREARSISSVRSYSAAFRAAWMSIPRPRSRCIRDCSEMCGRRGFRGRARGVVVHGAVVSPLGRGVGGRGGVGIRVLVWACPRPAAPEHRLWDAVLHCRANIGSGLRSHDQPRIEVDADVEDPITGVLVVGTGRVNHVQSHTLGERGGHAGYFVVEVVHLVPSARYPHNRLCIERSSVLSQVRIV
jgi:hypothetical protein